MCIVEVPGYEGNVENKFVWQDVEKSDNDSGLAINYGTNEGFISEVQPQILSLMAVAS